MGHGIGESGLATGRIPPGRPASDATPVLLEILDRRIPTAARRWLARGTRAVGPSFDAEAFLAAFGDAGRWLGGDRLDLAADERDRLRGAGLTWPLGGWTLDDLGRVVQLVLVLPRLPDDRHRPLIDGVWDRAMIDERRALLRALPLLPRSHRFLDLALAGAESPIPEIFEAIAFDNPLPAAAFPDEALEALVLKALVLGSSVDRIQGLSSRVTPAMSRTLQGYARARGEGGLPVPRGLSRLVAAGGRGPAATEPEPTPDAPGPRGPGKHLRRVG